jgi:primosomal protein N' (replication factor Y)
MIRLVVRGPQEVTTEQFAEHIAGLVRESANEREFTCRVLGPAPAPIAKLRGQFRFHTLVLAEDGEQLRGLVREITQDLKSPEGVQWMADVDPLDML